MTCDRYRIFTALIPQMMREQPLVFNKKVNWYSSDLLDDETITLVVITSNLILGQGGISIWTSTGNGNLNTAISLAGESGLQVLGTELRVDSRIQLNTGVSADAVVAAGSTVSACTVMGLHDLTVGLAVTVSGPEGKHEIDQDLRFPGMTFNLGNKINQICNELL